MPQRSNLCFFFLVLVTLGVWSEGFTPTHNTLQTAASRTQLWQQDDKDSLRQGHDDDDNYDGRRHFLQKVGSGLAGMLALPLSSSAAVPTTTAVPTPPMTKDVSWPLGKVAFSLLPLAGTSTRRATVQETILPDRIWTHDQIQGVVNVNVPVRQTVVKLSPQAGGGLWVHNPVAPTPQLLDMMQQLEQQHGPVRHIVLGTVALEHKATFGAFARHFPKATVWIQPGTSCLSSLCVCVFALHKMCVCVCVCMENCN